MKFLPLNMLICSIFCAGMDVSNGSKSPCTKERMRYLAVTLIAKSPTLVEEHHALCPSDEYPSEFILDSEHSIKLKKEDEQSDPIFDVTIFDTKTHRPFSPQIQCPFLLHSETIASFSRGGITYTAHIIPQIIKPAAHTAHQHK